MKPEVFKLNGSWYVVYRDVDGEKRHVRFVSWGWAIATATAIAKEYSVTPPKDPDTIRPKRIADLSK